MKYRVKESNPGGQMDEIEWDHWTVDTSHKHLCFVKRFTSAEAQREV